nr:MAG TPA: Endo N acetylneuraminidase [Caudoviricetes sp.]
MNSIRFSSDVSFLAIPNQDFKVYKDNTLTYFTLNATKGITVKMDASFEKGVKCDGQIQAVSFNATSDKRAKTNIKRLDQEKALDIVNKLPVYSFNYKKDNIPSIGVLAQEASVYDGAIPNFSLVNNEQATGENGDYQTVKESKLVYILWAAIQEQSRQINQLKSQLKELQK